MGQSYFSYNFIYQFFILFNFVIREKKMNLLKQEMKELVKERYYEYLEEGYEPFEAMELAKKDIEERAESDIGAYKRLYDSSFDID